MCLICFDLAFFFCNWYSISSYLQFYRTVQQLCTKNDSIFILYFKRKEISRAYPPKKSISLFFCFKNHWLFKFHLNKADEEAFFLFALVFFAIDSKNKHTTVLVIVYQFLRYFLLFLQKKLYWPLLLCVLFVEFRK